jgi:hypothetical protein
MRRRRQLPLRLGLHHRRHAGRLTRIPKEIAMSDDTPDYFGLDQAPPSRRLGVFQFSPYYVTEILRGNLRLTNLPASATIVRVFPDAMTNCICIVVEHPSYPPCPDGCYPVPILASFMSARPRRFLAAPHKTDSTTALVPVSLYQDFGGPDGYRDPRWVAYVADHYCLNDLVGRGAGPREAVADLNEKLMKATIHHPWETETV